MSLVGACAATRRVRIPRTLRLLRRARWAFGLLALLALVVLPAAAEAQTRSVSNITESADGYDALFSEDYLANAFTTGGTSTDRYPLTNVVIALADGTGQLDVSIHAVGATNASNPGEKIGSSLTGTATVIGGNTTYTASGITLKGGTTYFLRIGPSGADDDRGMYTTGSDTQTGTTGWSIANEGRFYDGFGMRWSAIGSGRSLRFTVNARADSTAPLVSTYSPADNATGVGINSDLVLTFNEPVKKGTGNIIIKPGSGSDITIDVTGNRVSFSDKTVTIDPASNLSASTNYNVRIAAGAIQDLAGNSYAGIGDATTWNFRTAAGADSTAPTVSTYSPTDGAGSVATNANLVLTFDEPVKKGTGNIVLNAPGSTDDVTIDVTGSRVSVSGKRVSIDPSADLAASTSFAVRIAATAFDDLAGNSYAGIADETTWNFTTVDRTPPTVSTYSPVHLASAVGTNANLVLTFDEPVKKGTGNINLDAPGSADDVTIDVTGSQVSVSGRTVAINPSSNLAANTGYQVWIAAGAIEDMEGNDYAGITSNPWRFTTGTGADSAKPTVSTYSPADGANGVATNANLVLTFNEPVHRGSGNITLNAPGSADDVTIDVTGSQVSVSGRRITIDPSANLAASTNYDVRIDSGAITDRSANGYDGIADATTWNFRTAAGADSTAPMVSTYSPADDATRVATDANLVLTFNEPVEAGSGSIVIRAATGGIGRVRVTSSRVRFSGTRVTIDLAANLLNATDYRVQIGAGAIQDLAGNSYAGIADNTTWNFSTVDLPPTVSSARVLGDKLTITFSELMGTARADKSAFAVAVAGATDPTVSSYTLQGDTAILTLSSAVTAGQTVTVSYTKPGSDPVIESAAGEDLATFSAKPVTNNTGQVHFLPAPTNLSLQAVRGAPPSGIGTANMIYLRFDGVPHATHYAYRYRRTSGGPWSGGKYVTYAKRPLSGRQLQVIWADKLSGDLTESFTFQVQAMQVIHWGRPDVIYSPMSAQLSTVLNDTSVTINAGTQSTVEAPAAVDPDSVRVTHNGSSLSVSWDAPARATHYDVTYYADGQAHARAAWNRAGTELTIACDVRPGYENQSCVEAGGSYFVGLRARNAGGESGWIYSSSAAQVKVDAVQFRDCATGAPANGRIEVQAAGGTGALASLCYGPAEGSPGFSLGGGDGGAFTFSTPETVTAGGVTMHRTAISRKADAPNWPLGPDDDGVWIFNAEVTNAGGNDTREVKVVAPGLWVADATVSEPSGAGTASLSFRVELYPSGAETVTVDYETRDGTAKAGALDYLTAKGTLTFAPGEWRKMVEVPVLGDAHDDGGETLTLVLANAAGAMIVDGEATGTITNDGPLQKAWLARFGRTVATHVTDAVGDRLRGAGDPGSHLTVGGYRLPLGQQAAGQEGASAAARGPALLHGLAGLLGLDLPPAGGPGATPEGAVGTGARAGGPGAAMRTDPRLGQNPAVNIDLRRLLLGSAFRLTLGAEDAGASHPRLTAWGRVAGTTFDGQDGALSLNGDVLTGTVGVDGTWARWLAGLAVAHSRGHGAFTRPGLEARGQGDLAQTLTSLHPYLRYAVTDRLDVWGLVGYGWGQMELDLATGETLETETNLMMGAFGGRGLLLAAPATGGLELATRTDAMLTRTRSDAVAGLAAADGDAHRLRLILEGTRGVTWTDGRSLTPTVELGLRHDWGDAETGFGLELGGRVQYADPRLGLTVEGAVRGLLAHEDRDYQEWGASGTLRVAPGEAGQGLSLTVAPTWGVAASGVADLWVRQTTAGLASPGPTPAAGGRVHAQVGYGVGVGTGLLTPFAETQVSGRAAGARTRVGLRWNRGRPAGGAWSLEVAGEQRAPAGGPPEQRIGLHLQVHFGQGGTEPPAALDRAVATPAARGGASFTPELGHRGTDTEPKPRRATVHDPAPTPARAPGSRLRYVVHLGVFTHPVHAVRARTALAGTLADVLRQHPLVLVRTKTDGRPRLLVAAVFRTRRAAAGLCAAIRARGPACGVVRVRQRLGPTPRGAQVAEIRDGQ